MRPYECRQAEPDDLGFVIKHWIHSYRSSHSAGMLSISPMDVPCTHCGAPVPHDYASVMGHVLRRVLDRPGVFVWVASNPRAVAPNNLHGFLVCEFGANMPSYSPPDFQMRVRTSREPFVHYVLVKRIYREMGVASALFKAAGIDPSKPFFYSCKTAVVASLEGVEHGVQVRPNKIPQARFFPLSVRFAKVSQIHDEERPEATVQRAPAYPAARQRDRRGDEERR